MKRLEILNAYFQAKRRARWSRKTIERHHAKRLKAIHAFASKNSPYYRSIFNGNFPVIAKKEMMENFSSLNTQGIEKEKALSLAIDSENTRNFDTAFNGISIGLSSGTSGNKGIFLASEREQAFWAGTILAKTLPKSILKKTSIGLFLRANNRLYETLNSNRISFHYYDLSLPFNILIKKLEREQPKILVAPPSALRLLVSKKLSYKPEKIISCAETLDPIDETYISNYFGKKVDQVYQCTEGFLASTCSHGTLHINEDLVHIEKEYIDKKTGRFVPIITDLYRKTQPIIRYRLDDILALKKKPCPCGSHFLALEKIEGRCDDILYFKDQTGNLTPLFPDFLRRFFIIHSGEITDYEMIQTSPEKLKIFTSPTVDLKQPLENFFEKKGLIPPKIIHMQTQTPRKNENKKRRIVRSFSLHSS